MTVLKRDWLRKKEAPKNKDASQDSFSDLKKDIVVMRKQGQPPVKDPNTFAQYVCDLCSTDHPISGLRQCVLCGRWACDACWKDEFYTCKSCSGFIKIHTQLNKQ